MPASRKRTISSWAQKNPAVIAGLLWLLFPPFSGISVSWMQRLPKKPEEDDTAACRTDGLVRTIARPTRHGSFACWAASRMNSCGSDLEVTSPEKHWTGSSCVSLVPLAGFRLSCSPPLAAIRKQTINSGSSDSQTQRGVFDFVGSFCRNAGPGGNRSFLDKAFARAG